MTVSPFGRKECCARVQAHSHGSWIPACSRMPRGAGSQGVRHWPINWITASFSGVTSFYGPLNRAFDAGLQSLRPAVVREMTARCTCSGSAAGARLQVARPECGRTGPSGTVARAPAPAVSPGPHQPSAPPLAGDAHQAPRSALIYYDNRAILWMPNSQSTARRLKPLS